MKFWQPRRWVGNIYRESKAAAKHARCDRNRFRNGFAASVADPAGLRAARAAGPGDEHFRAAGCPEMHHFIGFAALLAALPFCRLPVHEPNHPAAGAEIGEPAARTVYQRRGVLSARAAEPFWHEKRHRMAGVLSAFPRRRALADPKR